MKQKRFFALLLAVVFAVSLLPAVAVDLAEVGELPTETFALEEGAQTVSLLAMGEFSGTRYEEQLSGEMLQIYQKVKESELGPNPTEDTVFTAKVDLGFTKTWEGAKFTRESVEDNLTVDAETSAKYNAYVESLTAQILPALKALIYDEPELAWLMNITYSISTKRSYSLYWDDATQLSGTGTLTLTALEFSIAPESVAVLPETGTYKDFAAALEAAIGELNADDGAYNADAPGMSRYEQAHAIHDYVCDTVTYATDDLTQRKYQTVYSALVDESHTSVCAGYAKMFKVLCDAYGIPCVLVSGVSRDTDHIWNYVQMIDGNWYGVDATWDDNISHTVSTYFLQGRDVFDLAHTPDIDWGGGYAYVYPELAASAYEPTPEVTLSTVNGAQMRTTGKQGLRFISSIAKSGEYSEVAEFGMVLILTADITSIDELTIGATLNGHTVAKVPAVYRYAEDDASVTFTAVITDIADANLAREYTARAYAIMEDGTVVYGESSVSRSVYRIASAALNDPNISEDVRALFESVVAKVEG